MIRHLSVIVPTLFISILGVTSCSDSDQGLPSPTGDNVQVSFRLQTTESSDFSLSTSTFTRALTPLSMGTFTRVLTVAFYEDLLDEEGYAPQSFTKDSDLGQVSMTLSRGHRYKVAFFASDKSFSYDPTSATVKVTTFSPNIYWGITELTVPTSGPSTVTTDQAITLARPIAKVSIVSTDDYPLPLHMEINFTHFCSTLDMLTGYGIPDEESYSMIRNSFSKFLPDSDDKSASPMTFVDPTTSIQIDGKDFYDMGTVTVTLKDGESQVGYMKYNNLPLNRNQCTELRGNLFSQTNPFTLQYNDTWESPLNLNW